MWWILVYKTSDVPFINQTFLELQDQGETLNQNKVAQEKKPVKFGNWKIVCFTKTKWWVKKKWLALGLNYVRPDEFWVLTYRNVTPRLENLKYRRIPYNMIIKVTELILGLT